MITREDYLSFVASFNEGSKNLGDNRSNGLRFGQAFIGYLSKEKGYKGLMDSELFNKENRATCEQIIEQRYLHPME